MSRILIPFVQAVVDLAETMPEKEHARLAKILVDVLVREGLMHHLRPMPRLLQEEWHKRHRTVAVTITTPDGEVKGKAKLASALEEALEKNVELSQQADDSLLGGVQLAYEDERLDLSLKTALSRAAQALSAR